MRRLVVASLCAAWSAAAAAAGPWPQNEDGTPSVTDPSVPLSYVGNNASVSLGVNTEGDTEGQILGVFARNNERALVGQLWWDRNGAGGVQADFNWLWGLTALEAREHPDKVTVARLSFAIDQNGEHDRKATVGFGIERKEFSAEAYLAGGISSARSSAIVQSSNSTSIGSDEIGDYTQVDTVTAETIFDTKPYGMEFGLQFSHVFDPAMRLYGGAGYQNGDDGARANTVSVGLDTPLGTRGWGLSGLAQHVSSHDSIGGDSSDDRFALFLRYEFGSHGSFVPTAQLEDPAWISRSLARPSIAHPRNVESYRTKRSETVNVTHGPKQYINHFPLAQNDAAIATDGQPLTINVLSNDSDADGDALTVTAVTPPAHGTATIAGGAIVYTPAIPFTGTDTFRYTVNDGRGGTASAMVTITVDPAPDRPPQAVRDVVTTSYGRPVTIDVLSNDSDPDGDPLSIVGVTQPPNGSVTVNGTTVTYTPNPGFSGVDRFTYTVSDGHGGTSTAIVTITVTLQTPPPNRPPVAVDDTATTAFAQSATIDVLANDTDPDRDPLVITGVTPPANGTATVAGNAVTYTPAAGFSGTDRFMYSINDGRGGTSTAAVTVTVLPQPNRPPVAVDDAATTASGQPVTVNVLANDSDPDGDPLTISGVTAPANGTVSAIGGTITYTPAAGFAGTDRFTYSIDDGRGGSATAAVTITIAPPANQPPVAFDDTATTVTDQPVDIAVLNNDNDPDGDPLTIASVTSPANGTATINGTLVTYTPAFRFAGTDTFNYTISDGRGGTSTATVTVTVAPPANQPPIAVNDAATATVGQPVTVDVLANDSDPDGDPLSVIGVTQPANGAVKIVGNQIVYLAARGFTGFDNFTYTISDGRGGKSTATVAIFVLG
jgi:hypothetical protein